MSLSHINCPSCGKEISVSETMEAQMAERYNSQFLKKVQLVEAEMKAKADALTQARLDLNKQKELMNDTVAKKLSEEKAALEQKIKLSVEKQKGVEFEDLKNQIAEQTKKLDLSRHTELELRKKSRELEERQKELELEVVRRLTGEKEKIREEETKRISEEQRLKMAEKDKQMENLKVTIEELKRRSEVGSQQLQGEVLELELETLLANTFPIDVIDPVAKGAKGGDINHKVMTTTGKHVGTIVWESKRTKNWTEGWIDKIKEDQREIAAECAVIMSDILPKGISNLHFYDGVWVCDTKSAKGLAIALRQHLIEVSRAKEGVAGKDAKAELMYRYLTGTQFVQSVQSMAETVKDMKDSIENEKRALNKIWAVREKQVEAIAINAVSIYGSVQGIVGGALPIIETLELPGSSFLPEGK